MEKEQSKPEVPSRFPKDQETLQNMENVRLLKLLLLERPLTPELTEIVLKYAQEENVEVNLSAETIMEIDREHSAIESELREEAGKLIPEIKKLITAIEAHNRNHRIARLYGTSAEIVGGVVAVAGIIVTAASLGTLSFVGVYLTIFGGVVGLAGGVTHGGSTVVETVKQRTLTSSFQETFETLLGKFYHYQILHSIKEDIAKVGELDVMEKTKKALVGLKTAGTFVINGAMLAYAAKFAGSFQEAALETFSKTVSGKVKSAICKKASKVAADVTSKVCLGFNIAFVCLDIAHLASQVNEFIEGEKTEVTQKLTRIVLWLEKIVSGDLSMELDLNPDPKNSKYSGPPLIHSTPAVQRLEPRTKKKSDKNSVKIGLNADKTYASRCPEIEEVCTANKLHSV